MRLVGNYLYLAAAELLSKVLTFAAVAYLARVVNPEGYGYVEFASAVALCAGLVVDQGFGPYGAREIAKSPERSESLVSQIVSARVILAIAAYGAVVLFSVALDRSPAVTQLLLIYGLSLLLMPLLLQWVFQGHDRMQTVAAIQLLRQAVYAAVVFGFVRTAAHIWVAGVAEAVGVACAAMFGVWAYRRQMGGVIRLHAAIPRHVIVESLPIGLSQLFWMVRMFGATVILGLIAAPEDVGYFGGAMRILIALHTFIWLYYFNLLPSLAQGWQRGDGAFSSLTVESLRYVAWASGLLFVVWIALAPSVMVGVYGAAFAPAGIVLQTLVGVMVAAAVSGHYRFGLIAAGQQSAEMIASALGALCAIVLLPVGYRSMGPGGAALALAAAEILVWICAWRYSMVRLAMRGHVRIMALPVLAATLAAIVLWLPWAAWPVRTVGAVVIVTALAVTLDAVVRRRLQVAAGAGGSALRARLAGRPQGAAR
jgi:PST family polysaccharide transporter